MTEEQKEAFDSVRFKIEEEGINYALIYSSNWDDIEDDEFHRLRKNYIEASDAIRNYVNKIVEDGKN